MTTRQLPYRFLLRLTLWWLTCLPVLLATPDAANADTPPRLGLWESPINHRLRQGSILQVLEDSGSVLWVVTLEGITRFQGGHSHHYQTLPGEIKDTQSRRLRVTGIVEAWRGKILVATLGTGLLVFDEPGDRFRSWPWGDGHREGDLHIAELTVDGSDQLWLGLENGEVVRLQYNGHYQRIGTSMQSGRISSMRPLAGGGVVTSTLNGQISWLSDEGSVVRRISTDKLCQLRQITEILPLDSGAILLGTRGAGLWHIDQHDRCTRVPGFNTVALAHSSVHTLYPLKTGKTSATALVATDNGLLEVGSRGIRQHLHRGNSALRDNETISIHAANGGLAWIGTYDGLYLLDQLIFDHASDESHPRLQTITGLAGLPDGRLVVGTYQGLLVRDGARHLTPGAAGLPDTLHNQAVMGVYQQAESLFVAYRDKGLEQINLASGTIRRFNTDSHPGLSSNAVSAVWMTTSNHLLIGTYGGGLTVLDPAGNIQVYRTNDKSRGLVDDHILLLHQSTDGQVWVGTERGLQRFDLLRGHFDQVATGGNNAQAITPVIWAVTETDSGELWFGSLHEGLWRLQSGTIYPDQESQSQRQTIYALEADTEGSIWYTSNQGLNLRQPSGEHQHMGNGFGMPRMEFELGSSHRDARGFLYFGGNQGYFRFHPQHVQHKTASIKVAFTQYHLAGHPPKSLHDNEGKRSPQIKLGTEDHWVGIEYSALDYRNTNNMRYRYRLRGLDPDWIDAGTSRQAIYTNLPRGTYQFDVQATPGSNFAYAPASSLTLTVPAPPWQSAWAIVAYGLFAIALVLAALHQYRLYADRHHARLQAQESEAAAGRMADSLLERQQHHLRLLEHLHAQQKHLLEWSLPVELGGLTREQEEAMQAFLALLDEYSLGTQEQLYIDLHSLVETLSETSGQKSCPALIVNECGCVRLPWQIAMGTGLALWCLLEGMPPGYPGEETCLMITNEPPVLTRTGGSCQLRIHGDFRPAKWLSTDQAPPVPWQIARQTLVASHGTISFDTKIITLNIRWQQCYPDS